MASMENFIKEIKKNIPDKSYKHINDKFNLYRINIGKIINNKCFNNDIGNEMYMKLLNYFYEPHISKNTENHSDSSRKTQFKWQNMIQDTKIYCYNDLQLVINSSGYQVCQKEKKWSYTNYQISDNNVDMKLSLYRFIKIPVDIFPPINEYCDIRKMKKYKFFRNDVTTELCVINHLNKQQTYEINLYTNYRNLDKLLENVYSLLQLFHGKHEKITSIGPIYIDNDDYNKLSLSI